MQNLLINYAVSFTEISGISPVRLDYLNKMAVVCKGIDAGKAGWHECTTEDAVKAVTADKDALVVLKNLNSVYLIVLDPAKDLSDAQATLDLHKHSMFTTVISSVFTDSDIETHSLTHPGVIGAVFTDRTKAKAYAVKERQCAGYSQDNTKKVGILTFAFSKMLSNQVAWRDQQYAKYSGDPIWAASDVGTADALFNDRVTFYLADDDEGTCLGFFGAGGKSITYYYIAEEIKKVTQSTAAVYISTNMPMNTLKMRMLLQNQLQAVIDGYETKNYLDDEFDNEIEVSRSNKQFFVNGRMEIKQAEPIWRMAIEAVKES